MIRGPLRPIITNPQRESYILLPLTSSVEIKEDHGTSNITVADEDGLVISITTTVGLGFGSHVIVPGYGIVLNDSMDDFSVEGRPNGTGYEPQKANYGERVRRRAF